MSALPFNGWSRPLSSSRCTHPISMIPQLIKNIIITSVKFIWWSNLYKRILTIYRLLEIPLISVVNCKSTSRLDSVFSALHPRETSSLHLPRQLYKIFLCSKEIICHSSKFERPSHLNLSSWDNPPIFQESSWWTSSNETRILGVVSISIRYLDLYAQILLLVPAACWTCTLNVSNSCAKTPCFLRDSSLHNLPLFQKNVTDFSANMNDFAFFRTIFHLACL